MNPKELQVNDNVIMENRSAANNEVIQVGEGNEDFDSESEEMGEGDKSTGGVEEQKEEETVVPVAVVPPTQVLGSEETEVSYYNNKV